MHYEKLEAGLDELLLDLENPRTGRVETQSEALAAIIRLSGRNFRNMMRSIKEHGLDPGDSFYLVQEEPQGDGYTVVDGNRRLAALKVLDNPLLLKGTQLPEATVKPLAKEAEGFSFDDDFAVSCVLFDNRGDARDWIERRHGRGMEGEGRIAWGALDIQRFQNDRTVIDVIAFVEKNSTFTDNEWAGIKASVEKNTSSLRRFLESKSGRKSLGFQAGDAESGPQFTKDGAFVVDLLSQILKDIDTGEINTRSYNKASDIEEYFDSLPKPLQTRGVKAGKAQPFAATLVKDGKKRPRQSTKAKPITATKTKKVAPVRKTLAPLRHPFAEPTVEKGKQLIRECSKLRLRETPLSCAFCFRAVIEYAIETHMRAHTLPSHKADGSSIDLLGRVEAVITDVYSRGLAHKGDLTPIRTTLSAKNGSMSIGALNGYVHNKVQMPSSDDLRLAWDHAVPLFVAIFGPAK